MGLYYVGRCGNVSSVHGNINAEKYQEILDENLWPVKARHFPAENYIISKTMLRYIRQEAHRSISTGTMLPA